MAANEAPLISSNIIVCEVQQKSFNHPQFDSTNAKNNTSLTDLVGGISVSGEEEVERKFAEADEKLKKGYTLFAYTPCKYFTVIPIHT